MFAIFPHLAAETVDVRAFCAVEPAAVVEEALGAVAGDGGAEAGDLLLHPGLVLHTPGDVRPGPVFLHQTSSIHRLQAFGSINIESNESLIVAFKWR